MKAAVYYPHLKMESEGLLKHALLFWDHVDVITPFERLDFPKRKDLAEASELIARAHRPTEEEKQAAHTQLLQLLSKPLPAWFYINSGAPQDFIYTQKFMHRTWRELSEVGLAQAATKNAKMYWSNQSFATVMMGILADCCAGKTKVTITDKPHSYQALENSLAVETNAEQRIPEKGEMCLVRTEVLSPSLSNISLSNLISLRKKEHGNDGQKYRAMRHNLFEEIATFSESLVAQDYSAGDRDELKRQFFQKLDDDFRDIKTELGIARNNWIFSKEMISVVASSAAVVAGSAALPGSVPFTIAATSLTAAGLANKYKAERHKALAGHFSSYLYLASQPRPLLHLPTRANNRS